MDDEYTAQWTAGGLRFPVGLAVDSYAKYLKAIDAGLGVKVGGIGDVTSDRAGSAARYNAGKPAIDLIPLRSICDFYVTHMLDSEPLCALLALERLADWQEGGNAHDLRRALQKLGDGWEECAAVFAYGRVKYAAWNWAKGFDWSVPMACAARHLLAIIRGETVDPESGLSHRGHVFCNIVMLQTFARTYPQGDDRSPLLRAAK